MNTTESLGAGKLRPSDFARLSTVGLRTRKLRAGLSALGIAIGVAAIVAVLGLSSSAQAGLLTEISQLGQTCWSSRTARASPVRPSSCLRPLRP